MVAEGVAALEDHEHLLVVAPAWASQLPGAPADALRGERCARARLFDGDRWCCSARSSSRMRRVAVDAVARRRRAPEGRGAWLVELRPVSHSWTAGTYGGHPVRRLDHRSCPTGELGKENLCTGE